jgi:Ni/Co efflux regulator RcnB
MKKLPIIVAAVGLMLAAPVAQAAPDQRKDGGPTRAPHAQQRADKPAKASRPAARPKVTRADRPNAPRARQAPARQKPAVVNRNRNRNANANVRRNAAANARNRVDVSRYRRVVRATRRFHASRPWVAPRGYSYRRFSLGQRIPALLLVSTYFLTDYSNYGLEPAPYGYVWVRDGSDAVLVDRETGEVIQVQYDIFY